MRTSISSSGFRTTSKHLEIMTIVSEQTNEPESETNTVVKDTPLSAKKVSIASRKSKTSIQQKIYKKVKVKFDKSTKSYQKSLPRLVEKNGSCNIVSRTTNGKTTNCLSDLCITFIETKWRFVLPTFGMSFVISWIAFAGVFFGISSAHGDFEDSRDKGHTSCIVNSPDFISLLLFSMETQTTIGYGSRYPSDECPGTIFFVMIQSIWGALLQALLTGVVIVKVQKPSKRGNTILFSKHVCIFKEHDEKYLSIRVADLQKSEMIETSVRAVCVVSTLTTDGDFISHFRHDMQFKLDKQYSRISLWWPATLTHRLNPHSPLYNMDEDDLRNSDLELIVLMDGITASTGMTVQARTSYTPDEFNWQHQFTPINATVNSSGNCEFDMKRFHETEEIHSGIMYAPYQKLRRVNLSPSSESGFSEGTDNDISFGCSELSLTHSNSI